MNSSTPLVFSRLYLPHPLPPAQVAAFLTRLATERAGRPLVLETRADAAGVVHLLGCEVSVLHRVRRILKDLIPGTIMAGLDGYARRTVVAAGRLRVRPAALPLSTADPDEVLRPLYSALSRSYSKDEAVCIQVVIGNGHGPQQLPRSVPDPTASLWKGLLLGQVDASAEIRGRMRDRATSHGLEVVLRIGAAGTSAKRRTRMVQELLAAMSVAQSPGVSLELLREDPNRLNVAPLSRRGVMRLSVPELVGLVCWPAGETPLPGNAPAHPKLLRADASVYSGDAAFAVSDVPGDSRRLGLTPADMSFHGYALGPTGVGKTHLLQLIAESAMQAGQPLLVLDPKAQMHDYLLERVPAERFKDVVLIDGTEKRPMGFNPLDASGRDPDVVADGALAVFARVFAEGWGPRTADIFSASLRTLTRTGSAAAPNTLVDLPRLWTDASFRRGLVAQVQGDVALSGFWSWYESLQPTGQAAVIASPMNKLRQVLLRPAAVKLLGQRQPGFRLRDIFRDRAIVLLPLNEGLLGPLTTELIGSLAIAETWQAVQERATERQHQKHPGLVIVDEADRFMNLPVSLVDALARSRSLSVSWWLATQYWDQLPKEMKSAVKTNARSKVIFRLESDDDARTIARMAPGLSDQDFMALGKYQVYLRLVSHGITTDWALAKTLPSTAPVSDPAEVRRIARQHRQPGSSAEDNTPDLASADRPDRTQPPNAPIGRRKRSS